ncbi:MAG: hypothetical protein POH28_02905 [Acidocella sp.]|nr:hypothetical protein [Acidocella sp.]
MDDRLAKDWVAMWQSELSAMGTDRELRETWATLMGLWAEPTLLNIWAAQAQSMWTRPARDPARSPNASQPPGSTPAAAASQPGLDEISRLTRRIDELEQSLERLIARDTARPADPDIAS